MREKGLESELRNNIYYWVRTKKKEFNPQADALFYKKAQIQWDKRIHKSLNSMCSELGMNLAKVRSSADREELTQKWGELSNYDVGKTSAFKLQTVDTI